MEWEEEQEEEEREDCSVARLVLASSSRFCFSCFPFCFPTYLTAWHPISLPRTPHRRRSLSPFNNFLSPSLDLYLTVINTHSTLVTPHSLCFLLYLSLLVPPSVPFKTVLVLLSPFSPFPSLFSFLFSRCLDLRFPLSACLSLRVVQQQKKCSFSFIVASPSHQES